MADEANVAEITEADIPEVADFLARQVRAGEALSANPLPPADRLRWLLLENPAREVGIPLGWRIRGARGIVGAAVCVPFRIAARGFSSTALMFAKFFVDPPYRGMGLGLLMRFVREGKRFPLFVTSTNAIAGELFSRVGGRVIGGMDHTMLGVARVAPLAEEFLYRRTHSAVLARTMALPTRLLPARDLCRSGVPAASSPASARMRSGGDAASTKAELLPLATANGVAALGLPEPGDALAVVRDRPYLHWRYFSGERDQEIYCLKSPGAPPTWVVVSLVRSGYRGQIRVLNVLDVWPPASPAVALELAGQLSQHYRGRFDVIWLRSQSADVEATLQNNGWRRHAFPAPLGWYIDSQKRLPTENWYIVPGESE